MYVSDILISLNSQRHKSLEIFLNMFNPYPPIGSFMRDPVVKTQILHPGIFIFYLQETRVEKGRMCTHDHVLTLTIITCTWIVLSPNPTPMTGLLRTQINLIYVYSSRPTLLLSCWVSSWSIYYAEHSIKYWGPGREQEIYKSDWTTLYLKFYGTRITISEKNLRP